MDRSGFRCEATFVPPGLNFKKLSLYSNLHGLFEVAFRHDVVTETVEILNGNPFVGSDESN